MFNIVFVQKLHNVKVKQETKMPPNNIMNF